MVARCSLILFMISLGWHSLPAQESSSGSAILEKYIKEGLSGNLLLKQEQLEVSKALQSLRQAKALFYPQVTFAPTYSVAFGGRRLAFPVGDMLNPAYAALNELTGSDRFPTDIRNVNELLAPHNFQDTKVSFQYSIYNPEIKYNYLIQNSLLSAAEARSDVVAAEIRYAVAEAYYGYLMALKIQEIYKASRATLAELVRLNSRLADNNVVTKDAVLAAEYELSSADRQGVEADKNVNTARAYFNFLLNRELEEEIVADTLIGSSPFVLQGQNDLQQLIGLSLSGRPELKQLDYVILAAKQGRQLQEKAAALPSLFIGGNTGFQGYGYRFKDQEYLIAQLGLRWDLFKGYERKARISQAQIQEDMLRIRQTEAGRRIALEVTQAYYALKASGEGLKVAGASADKARAYYSVVDSRYRNRNVLLLEYLKAANDWQTARIQQVLARYEFLTRLAHLERVTGREYY